MRGGFICAGFKAAAVQDIPQPGRRRRGGACRDSVLPRRPACEYSPRFCEHECTASRSRDESPDGEAGPTCPGTATRENRRSPTRVFPRTSPQGSRRGGLLALAMRGDGIRIRLAFKGGFGGLLPVDRQIPILLPRSALGISPDAGPAAGGGGRNRQYVQTAGCEVWFGDVSGLAGYSPAAEPSRGGFQSAGNP